MSTKSKSKKFGPLTAAATAAAAEDTPTPTFHQQLANGVLKTLGDLAASIPNLETPHPATRRFVDSHSGYPLAFLHTTVSAVEQSAELQAVKKLDPIAARDTLQFLEAFLPVIDAIERLRDSLRFTIDARKANLAADCLQIMAIGKGISRDPSSATVREHVGSMQRDLGRLGRRASKPAEPPKPPATPAVSEPRANAARSGDETPVTR